MREKRRDEAGFGAHRGEFFHYRLYARPPAAEAARQEADPLVIVADCEVEEASQFMREEGARGGAHQRRGEHEAEADVRVQPAGGHPALEEDLQQLAGRGRQSEASRDVSLHP